MDYKNTTSNTRQLNVSIVKLNDHRNKNTRNKKLKSFWRESWRRVWRRMIRSLSRSCGRSRPCTRSIWHFHGDRLSTPVEKIKALNELWNEILWSRLRLRSKGLITYFSILNGFKDGIFNDGCMSVKIHVPQHHDSTQQKSSWIGQVLSCYIGGRAMNLGM